MPQNRRPPIPIPIQVEVFFRDRWLCHLCRRPIVLHLAMKYAALVVHADFPRLKAAYWHPNWRRDAAPLLDELGASIDHVKAFSRGGAHDASNFAAVCARCNARKSALTAGEFLASSKPWRVHGAHGEPSHWDGMSSLFVALARRYATSLTATERSWLAALEPYVQPASEASGGNRTV